MHLVGLLPSDLEDITEQPAAAALLRRGVALMEESQGVPGSSSASTQEITTKPRLCTRSAKDFGDGLNEGAIKFVEDNVEAQFLDLDITKEDTSKPRRLIGKLAEAKRAGKDVSAILQDKAMLIKMESSRKNLPSVASGLRAWHAFAVALKGYKEEASLPPVDEDHVVEFVSLFKSSKTARNYVSYVKWACVFFGLKTS